MKKEQITAADLQRAAEQLRVDVATIRTVMAVESSGDGFKDGRVTIRFEPHKFSQLTKKTYDKSHPDLSFPVRRTGYPYNVDHSWILFSKAASLNPNAAVMSTSWGLFQILGSNFVACGCANLGEFVRRMEESEGEQLLLFCNLILDWGLDDELRDRKWALFARIYNGPGYRTNQYDTRMAKRYAQFSSTG